MKSHYEALYFYTLALSVYYVEIKNIMERKVPLHMKEKKTFTFIIISFKCK